MTDGMKCKIVVKQMGHWYEYISINQMRINGMRRNGSRLDRHQTWQMSTLAYIFNVENVGPVLHCLLPCLFSSMDEK